MQDDSSAEGARAGEAPRRTLLANERTHLAWWRTGIGCLAVGIGTGSIAPNATGGTLWPYVAVGMGYVVLGIAFIVYGVRRFRDLDAAIGRGEFLDPHDRFMTALAVYGVALGLATFALLVYQFYEA